jgi:flagellar protein FliS
VDGLNAYRQTAVATTGPAGLVVLLYRRLAALLEAAAGAADRGDWDRARPAIVKAQEVTAELWSALDLEADGPVAPVARSLFSIYDFIYRALAEAYVRRDPSRLPELARQVENLLKAWEEAAERAGGV